MCYDASFEKISKLYVLEHYRYHKALTCISWFKQKFRNILISCYIDIVQITVFKFCYSFKLTEHKD